MVSCVLLLFFRLNGRFVGDYTDDGNRGFIVQGPICFVALLSVTLTLHLPVPKSSESDINTEPESWRSKLRRIDFLGALILLSATTALLVGLDTGSNYSWTSRLTLTSLFLSIPLYLLFLLVEARFASYPFAPGRIIFSRSLFPAYMANLLGYGAYIAVLFYVPLFLQATQGLSSTEAGVRLIPAIVCSVVGSLSGGYIMKLTGRYYWLTLCSECLMFLGVAVMTAFAGMAGMGMEARMTSWGILTAQCLTALGNGVTVTSTFASSSLSRSCFAKCSIACCEPPQGMSMQP